jgi:hypothetical protein
MPTTRQMFTDQRKVILEKLRFREPELVRELESVDLALQNLGDESPSATIFTGYKNAIDAITSFLSQIMRTEDQEIIAQSIVDGGWLKGNRNALKNARASLKFHIDRSPDTKAIKQFPSGRIGLYSWSIDFDKR